MARPGITYQDVATAANELKGLGKSPTIEGVRNLLGTGSIGTINQHLRKWKEVETATRHIPAKENLPDCLIALIKGLWDGVLTLSSEQFAPIEKKYEQEILELKSELEKYKSNNQRWQQLFNQWQQEKTKLENEKLTLEQALDFAHKENQSLHVKHDGLLQQLQEKQLRVEELHRLHQQMQANLEHYRESAREQRLMDQEKFEKERQQTLFEIKELKEQLLYQHAQCSELHQKNQLIEKSYVELDNKYNQSVLIVESLKNEIHSLEKTNIEYQQMSQHWQNQFKEIENRMEIKLTELITLQNDNKTLCQQLDNNEQLLHDLKDQNKLLIREKWELIQEKSLLEGELKQMQKTINIELTRYK